MPSKFSGDIFDRELEFDFGNIYNVVGFRMDCRLADAIENVDKAAKVMVCNFLFKITIYSK